VASAALVTNRGLRASRPPPARRGRHGAALNPGAAGNLTDQNATSSPALAARCRRDHRVRRYVESIREHDKQEGVCMSTVWPLNEDNVSLHSNEWLLEWSALRVSLLFNRLIESIRIQR
jgi:hypothetical protein